MAYNHPNDEINEYIKHYDTNEKRVGYCKFALKKYKFENYKLSDNNIIPEDNIIQDQNLINDINNIINNNECNVNDFKNVLNSLSHDQLYYIGF